MNASRHAAIDAIEIVDDELAIGGIAISDVARDVGRTPFYVYDRALIERRVAMLRDILPSGLRLHYAMKANPLPAVVRLLASIVDGVDVASVGELRVALASGANPAEISFAGPGKRDEELAEAAAVGILVNVESFREIRLLGEINRRLGRPVRVAVRVNPSFELKSSGMKMGGGPKPFGIDAEDVPDALAEIGRHGLAFEGFHIFSGSQNLRHDSICEAQSQALDLAIALAHHVPGPVRSLNLGGGFGIPYFPGETSLDVAPVATHLYEIITRAAVALPDASIVLELGRYLVGEAGYYICRVIDRKVSRGRVFLVTDGGLHHHLAASGNFGQVLRKNYPVVIANHVVGIEREIATIVGPLCTPLDVLADQMDLAVAQEGDLVAVLQSGAYGYTASPLAFLGHPTPAEVLR